MRLHSKDVSEKTNSHSDEMGVFLWIQTKLKNVVFKTKLAKNHYFSAVLVHFLGILDKKPLSV